MTSSKLYIPLPLPQTPPARASSKPPMHRRPTLTPSTVSPPSLSAQTSAVLRTQTSPDRATSLLAKVASNPASRRHTPAHSPLPSPAFDGQTDGHRSHRSLAGGNDEVARKSDLSRTYGQQDGYISFPDFERYRESCEAAASATSGGQDRQGIKT